MITSFFLLIAVYIYERIYVGFFPGNPSSYEFSIFPRIFLFTLHKVSAMTSILVGVSELGFA